MSGNAGNAGNAWNERNVRVIADFRASRGAPGGREAGRPLLLLTTTGARTGQRRTTPLVYLADGERLLIFASKGGSPTNPDWYHNLVANPQVTVEVGPETYEARATVLHGEERDRLFARQVAAMPNFGEYQQKTRRTIPVIALSRIAE
ncbi:MAG TPA: nitroreductase family deazaflavin-dependent oxidoreductase [Chloroflexota bacterium]|nr:nitroreductase family deazaflavin-dependent oxidoreductase [Chloroflexota bacterium]